MEEFEGTELTVLLALVTILLAFAAGAVLVGQ